MKINFKFDYKNLLIAVFIFLIEVLIATKLKDIFFVRAYLGDVIVVMLIYYFIKAFFKIESTKLIVGIFIFSCLIETLQHFKFAEVLGFQKNPIMMTVLGNSFSWVDILCYFTGCIILFLITKLDWNKNNSSHGRKAN